MQSQRPRRSLGPIGQDFGFSDMPAKPMRDQGFGRGYAIGFFASCLLIIASFFLFFVAKTDLSRARATACLFGSFGVAFTFVVVYTIVTNKGVGWSSSVFGKSRSTVIERKSNPVGFWLLCGLTLIFSCSLLAGGVWIWTHAGTVADFIQQHPGSDDGD